MKTKLVFAIAATTNSVGWGLYFTFVTRYLAIELGGGDTSVLLFIGLTWFFTLLGILTGKIVEIMGDRNAILLGLLQGFPAIGGILMRDPQLLSLVLSSSAFPWVIHWSVVLKVVFTRAGSRPGREYGEVTIGTGLGFALGSLATGLFYAIGGVLMVFAFTAILLAIPPLIYYSYYPIEHLHERSGSIAVFSVIKKVLTILLSLSLVVFAREILYSLAPVKINSSLEEVIPGLPEWAKYTIYGLAYSGGALISPLARIWAGRLVDSHGSLKIYTYTVVGYTLLYWFFMKTKGLIPILLWQVPLFPFLDTAFNVYMAKRLPSNELVAGFGISQAFTAIGGLLIVPLLILEELDVDYIGFLIALACTFSIVLIISESKKK